VGWAVVALLVTLLVAFFVISHFSEDEDDWSANRPGRTDPDEGHLEDLLGP
jgi:hypothetical protein